MCRGSLTLFLAFLSVVPANASGPFEPLNARAIELKELPGGGAFVLGEASGGAENTRSVASGLALLLGPFGAHRLYLGTTPKVAIVYGTTFAGFGTLVLLDLGHLLFTKDLEPFRNNDRVFMWNPRSEATTPP